MTIWVRWLATEKCKKKKEVAYKKKTPKDIHLHIFFKTEQKTRTEKMSVFPYLMSETWTRKDHFHYTKW